MYNFSYLFCNAKSKLIVELAASVVYIIGFVGKEEKKVTAELLKVIALPQAKHGVGRSCADFFV